MPNRSRDRPTRDRSRADAPAAPVVLRSPRRGWAVGLLAVVGVANIVLSLAVLAALPLGVLLLVQAYAQSRTAVVLEPEVAVVKVGLFTRRVRWADVTEVARDRALGIERLALVTSRARFRLPVPSTGPLGSGAAYDEQVCAVRAAWDRGRRRREGGSRA